MKNLLQVADALDDMLIDCWVHPAAERLKENALSLCKEEIKRELVDSLFLLPDQLRHRLLVAAAFDLKLVHSLLGFFPMGLHSAVVGAMIPRDKEFRMPFSLTWCPALRALASLPAHPPSVLALYVDDGKAVKNWRMMRDMKVEDEIWACLKLALHHHVGITSLG